MIEREVKIRVQSHDPLRPLLTQIGAVFIGKDQEVNRILDTPEGTLFKKKQILRVRSTGDGVLTWKGPAAEQEPNSYKQREEVEIPISGTSVETLTILLERLGFAEVLRYEKQRESWRWEGVVITLDSLVFGTFVEIEGEARAIDRAVKLLQLSDLPLETRSYPELQRQYQQQCPTR